MDLGAYEFQGTLPGDRETASSVVTTTDDRFDLYDGAVSLREALLYAGQGAVGTAITFDAALDGGTIILDGEPLYLDRAVSIDASTLGSLTLDAAGRSRVLTVLSSEAVQLAALTIRGGSATNGGGICNWGTVTITGSSVSGNSGGGIYNAGTLTLTNSIVVGNSASSGGGIYHSSGTVTITNSTIASNSATSAGGGIYQSGGTLVLANSIVALNAAPTDPDLRGTLAAGKRLQPARRRSAVRSRPVARAGQYLGH